MKTTERTPAPGQLDQQAPSIVEKVRFWEEQDRINQAVIPRLIKLHETLQGLVQGRETAAEKIAEIDADTKSVESAVRGLESTVNDLADRLGRLETAKSTSRGAGGAVYRLCWAALGMSGIAIILAVVAIITR